MQRELYTKHSPRRRDRIPGNCAGVLVWTVQFCSGPGPTIIEWLMRDEMRSCILPQRALQHAMPP